MSGHKLSIAQRTFNIVRKQSSGVKYPPIEQFCIFSKIRKLREHQKIQQIDNPNLSGLIKKRGGCQKYTPSIFYQCNERSCKSRFQQANIRVFINVRWNLKMEQKVNPKENIKIRIISQPQNERIKRKKMILQVRQSSLRNIKKTFNLSSKQQVTKSQFKRECTQLMQNQLKTTKYDISPRVRNKQDSNNCFNEARMTAYVKRMEHFSFFIEKDNLKFSRNKIAERQQERSRIFNQVQWRQRQLEQTKQKLPHLSQATEDINEKQNSSVPKDLLGRVTMIKRSPKQNCYLKKLTNES